MSGLLTPATPQTAAELESQISLLLEKLRTDLAEGNALDADILSGGIAVGVVVLVDAGRPDGIIGRERGDDGVLGGEISAGGGGAEEGIEDGLANDAHCD